MITLDQQRGYWYSRKKSEMMDRRKYMRIDAMHANADVHGSQAGVQALFSMSSYEDRRR